MNSPRYTVLVRARMLDGWREMEETNDYDSACARVRAHWASGNYSAAVRDNDTDELVYVR